MVVHALARCFFRLIDVGAMDGLAFCIRVCAAYCMIEEEDSVRSRNVLQDQIFHFGIVDLLDLVFGREICDFAGDVGGGGETVSVEFEGGFLAANVGDGDLRRVFRIVSLWEAFWRLFYVVPGFGIVWWWSVEDQGRGDWASGYFDILWFCG